MWGVNCSLHDSKRARWAFEPFIGGSGLRRVTLISGVGANEPLFDSVALDPNAASRNAVPLPQVALTLSPQRRIKAFVQHLYRVESMHDYSRVHTAWMRSAGASGQIVWDWICVVNCTWLCVCLCLCVYMWVSVCQHNALGRARRLKYASVGACHKTRGDLMASGCVYCAHVTAWVFAMNSTCVCLCVCRFILSIVTSRNEWLWRIIQIFFPSI